MFMQIDHHNGSRRREEVAGMSLAVAEFDTAVELGFVRGVLAPCDAVSELPCRTYDADLWFADSPADLETAKSLCARCPLRVECLAGAVERGEPWGVWGGEIFERGAVIPRKRPRGRPRKADLARDVLPRVEAEARAAALAGAV